MRHTIYVPSHKSNFLNNATVFFLLCSRGKPFFHKHKHTCIKRLYGFDLNVNNKNYKNNSNRVYAIKYLLIKVNLLSCKQY